MSQEARCPYCHDALAGAEVVVRCQRCRTPHHAACFEENRGCVSMGCGALVAAGARATLALRATVIDLRPPPPSPPRMWEDDAPDPDLGTRAIATLGRLLKVKRRVGEALAAARH